MAKPTRVSWPMRGTAAWRTQAQLHGCPDCGRHVCDGMHRGLNDGPPNSIIQHSDPLDPLPRCGHGNCLLDGGLEILAPPCGCTGDLVLALNAILKLTSTFDQRNLTAACLIINGVEEIAATAKRIQAIIKQARSLV